MNVVSAQNNALAKLPLLKQANHEDVLEEMDLKWQLALLSMKSRKFYQRTGKKIIINGSDTAECQSPRNQESRPRNHESRPRSQDSSRRTVNVEESSSKAMLAINGVGIRGCQIFDNNRKGVGYNAVAPPLIGLFAPPTIDLSKSGLEEFKQPKFEGYGVKVSDYDEDETLEKVSESANVQKPKQADQPRKNSQNPRNNSFNWNTPMSKKLGMVQKPVLNNVKKGTGQREVRPVWNNAMRTNHQNFSNSRRNFAPTTVLTKSGLVPISTARQSSSRAAAPVSTARPIKTVAPKPFVNVVKSRPNAFQKSHSPSRRSFYQHTTLKNRNLNNRVNTVKVNSVNTAKGKKVISDVGEKGIIEALFEEKLYGTMCINAVDYTTWILRMECKSCQVMKMD
ncbi:hypothetical protein Tco_0414321 [Tanacetum coccineum]